jgi:hypothetical protein
MQSGGHSTTMVPERTAIARRSAHLSAREPTLCHFGLVDRNDGLLLNERTKELARAVLGLEVTVGDEDENDARERDVVAPVALLKIVDI